MQRPLPTGRDVSILAAIAFAATVCLSAAAPAAAKDPPGENPFPGRFPAPSLEGGVEWFNTTGEIDIRELRGKIVLLDFWTYCCINCMHILPDLKYLERKYDKELVVIGVHSAKFDNEKDSENIRNAILRYEIEHPVVNDANGVIAQKYQFRAWPQLVLIDPEGQFVGLQTGEGIRDLFDMVIGRLASYHRAKGTLDESPVRFDLERNRVQPGPLKYPGKVLADADGGRLFISDSNHNRIVISTLDGQLVDVIGSGAIGARNGDYASSSFDHPQGMALVRDTLYVADTENHLIRKIDLQAKTVGILAGTGKQAQQRVQGGPPKRTALNSPWDILHHDGVLYIAMAGPHQLWRYRLGGNEIEVFAGTGREDIIDGPRDSCALAQPSGLASDGKLLYFVDSEGSAVRQVPFSGDGRVITIIGAHDLDRGRSLFEFGDIDGVAAKARLQHPIGLAWHDGLLYVTDTYNHKIKRVDPEQRTSETWLGTGEPGTSLSPVQLFEPAGASVANGVLYVADTNNHRILAVDLATAAAREFVVAGLMPPAPVEAETPQVAAIDAQEIPGQRIKPGESLGVRIQFELPEGFKLNQLGPVTYTLTAVGDQALIAAEHLGTRAEAEKGETDATFAIPLAASTGAGTYEVAVSYTYCRDGTGGVCRFANQAWRVPVELAADAVDNALTLTAKPK